MNMALIYTFMKKDVKIMKQKLFAQFLCVSMTFMTLLSSAPVYASSTTESQSVQQDASSEVIVNGLDSRFSVTVPKNIIGEGSEGTLSYTVTLEGDIAGNELVHVVPDESVTLSQKNKSDIIADVNQDKVRWAADELDIIGNGAITYEGVSAGTWDGAFNFNIALKSKSSITVSSKNEAGEDLNATAYEITESEKDQLLSSLVETGYVGSAEDVSALVEVKSDDFDGMAETTFDVSDIASEDDKVVILHFNEATNEWEYISTETVSSEGTVTSDFSSYSPVAFVRINEDNTISVPSEYYTISWTSSLSSIGTYIGTDEEMVKTDGGKRFVYINEYGERCYANPYEAGEIHFKKGTAITVQMYAGSTTYNSSYLHNYYIGGGYNTYKGMGNALISFSYNPGTNCIIFNSSGGVDYYGGEYNPYVAWSVHYLIN